MSIKVEELDSNRMVKLRCVIEHAQISLREDAYPTLIREGETCTVPETMGLVIKGNKKKARYGFEIVSEKPINAAPQMGGMFPNTEEIQQTGEATDLGHDIETTQLSEEEAAIALKEKRSASAKKAAATRALNAQADLDKKKE